METSLASSRQDKIPTTSDETETRAVRRVGKQQHAATRTHSTRGVIAQRLKDSAIYCEIVLDLTAWKMDDHDHEALRQWGNLRSMSSLPVSGRTSSFKPLLVGKQEAAPLQHVKPDSVGLLCS